MKREIKTDEKVRALLDFLDEDPPEQVAGQPVPQMTDDEVRRRIEAHGLDAAQVETKARAEHEAAVAALAATELAATEKENAAKVVPLAPRRMRPLMWLAPLAASFAAALAIEGPAVLAWWNAIGEPVYLVGAGREGGTASKAIQDARALRGQARAAVDRGDYAEAVERLDEAKRLDPAGDESPETRQLRARARRGSLQEP